VHRPGAPHAGAAPRLCVKLALNAGWDLEMLSLEIGELGEAGFDLSLTGFDEFVA
jgi:hypothetical protein